MKNVVISMISFYQRNVSSFFTEKNINRKFYPTCSEYTKQAVKKYGVIKGLLKGLVRIFKCNPFSKGGYDPLK